VIRVFRHYISSAYLWLLLIEAGLFFFAMYFSSELSISWDASKDVFTASLVFSLLLTLACSAMGLYRRSLSTDDYNLLARTTASFALAIVALIVIYYSLPHFFIARNVLAIATILAFIGIMTSRYLFYHFANLETLKRRVLVIGSGKKAAQLNGVNDSFIHKAFTLLGYVALPGDHTIVPKHQLIPLDKKLIEITELLGIDEIVIALDDNRRGLPLDELLDCKMSGLAILDLMSFYEREQGLVSLDNLHPAWLIFSDGFAQGGLRRFSKRLFDLLASLLLFLVAWPFMIITSLAIFFESGCKGPVFYRQLRVGENNIPFQVLKFRSMYTDAEKHGAQWAKAKDNRITRVGSIIRKFRIDELPQIFNVLRGEMSFVGPRPERPEFVSGFEERIPYYRERHRVKPGITGWAQLCYPYGADENDAIQKLQYDLYYVKNYSIFLDLSIMFNTVEVVLWGRGAR